MFPSLTVLNPEEGVKFLWNVGFLENESELPMNAFYFLNPRSTALVLYLMLNNVAKLAYQWPIKSHALNKKNRD